MDWRVSTVSLNRSRMPAPRGQPWRLPSRYVSVSFTVSMYLCLCLFLSFFVFFVSLSLAVCVCVCVCVFVCVSVFLFLCVRLQHPDPAFTQENAAQNRYTNILPYDHSRVTLRFPRHSPHTDYINASFVKGYKLPKGYIAAQVGERE
jgi:hypothetical protein